MSDYTDPHAEAVRHDAARQAAAERFAGAGGIAEETVVADNVEVLLRGPDGEVKERREP